MAQKILVIDDSPIVRQTLAAILRHNGYEIELAEDGKRGVAAFRAGAPDLVITDLIMPEKEGLETIRDIRRDNPDAKIVAISGGARTGHADFLRMAQAFGAVAVIAKPFATQEVVDCVKTCLGA
ncbi:MAG TPA: response regulator [Stellaceae bacterium]|jgi:CheY-like chemotaxis protein|nr:response regulator [Stellaceae bacterium]